VPAELRVLPSVVVVDRTGCLSDTGVFGRWKAFSQARVREFASDAGAGRQVREVRTSPSTTETGDGAGVRVDGASSGS
jgi:hypothetical protein